VEIRDPRKNRGGSDVSTFVGFVVKNGVPDRVDNGDVSIQKDLRRGGRRSARFGKRAARQSQTGTLLLSSRRPARGSGRRRFCAIGKFRSSNFKYSGLSTTVPETRLSSPGNLHNGLGTGPSLAVDFSIL
jgi:hypothetical protein